MVDNQAFFILCKGGVDMSEPVTRVEFVLTSDDLLQFHQQYLRRFGANRLRIPLMAASLILIPVAMMFDLLAGGLNFSVTAVCSIAAALVLTFFLVVFPMSIRGQARRAYYASADYQRPVAIDFYPSVMVASYRYTRYTIGYESIYSCCETTSHFNFYENKYAMQGHILPKSSLTSQEVDALSQKLSAVFGRRYLLC